MNAQKNIGATSVWTFGAEPLSPAPVPKTEAPVIEPYIDKIEVARRLGKTVRCVDDWMKRGMIPFFKIGRSVSFKWSDVEAHLAQNYGVGPRSFRSGTNRIGNSR